MLEGIPRYVFLLRPIGNNLDKVAIYIANADRFNPGTRNGQPAAVAVTIKASIQSCIEEKNDEHGQEGPLPPAPFYASAQVDLQKPPLKNATAALSEPIHNSATRPFSGCI